MKNTKLSTFEKTWGVLIPILVYKISTAFFTMVLAAFTDVLSRHGIISGKILIENSSFLSTFIRAISLTLSIALLFPTYVRTMRAKQYNNTEYTDNTDATAYSFNRSVILKDARSLSSYFGPLPALISVLSGMSLALFLNILFYATGIVNISSSFKEVSSSQASTGLLAGIILFGIITPVAEELVFRGIVLSRLNLGFSITPAIILSALMFGIYHGNLVQGIYGTLMGLLIGYVYIKYDALVYPILVHSGANILIFIITSLHLPLSLTARYEIMGISGIVFLITFVFLYNQFSKNKTLQ